ncbi:MAG: MoaD/ThiS family protein [Gemmatimonadota bacterium]|nr:MoaD/ThiS family protein [Gemmatimonadota bacterium]
MSRATEVPRVRIVLPSQLRDLTGERPVVTVAAGVSVATEASVAETFQSLRAEYPGVYERIFTETREVRPHINIFVDGADIRWSGGLETPVAPGSEIVVLPAVSGG